MNDGLKSAEASSSRDFSLQKLALKSCLGANGSFTDGRAEVPADHYASQAI